MLASGRQARLLERLRSRAYANTQDLSAYLGVSDATVRRDLIDLEARGLIRRTHGGAMPLEQITSDLPNDERMVRNIRKKPKLAKRPLIWSSQATRFFWMRAPRPCRSQVSLRTGTG
jgi:DeoR/GlpR family transcriptional regulator of sugar metabolism